MVFQPSKIPNFQENKTNLKPSFYHLYKLNCDVSSKPLMPSATDSYETPYYYIYIVILRTVFWQWIYLEVQSSTQYSSLLPLSLHIWIDTPLYLLFFFVSYRWKPTHISVLNRTVCEVILSQHASVSVVIQSALMFSIPYCYWKEETISKRSQVGPFSRNFIFSCLENRLQLTLGIHSHICAYERYVTERDESIRLTADLQLISMRSRLFENFLLTTSELYKGHLKNKAE